MYHLRIIIYKIIYGVADVEERGLIKKSFANTYTCTLYYLKKWTLQAKPS